MNTTERAGQIVEALQQARAGWPIGATFTVNVRGGCAACDPGACSQCGHLFTGEIFTIEHLTRGKRVISDRTVHYLDNVRFVIASGLTNQHPGSDSPAKQSHAPAWETPALACGVTVQM